MVIKLIDIGDFRLCVRNMGEGNHTVIFESSMGESLKMWRSIQENISDIAYTVSYDRAGIGKSEKSPSLRRCYVMAEELHRMLEKLNLKPPYIFVGASYGCYVVRTYASLYPNEIEGAVFVEPTHEDFITRLKEMHTSEESARFDELWEITASMAKRGYSDEWGNYEKDSEYIRSVGIPKEFPITIISSKRCGEGEKLLMQLTQRDIDMRCNLHKSWVLNSTNVKQIITQDSGHNVSQDEPELVISAIRELIESIK